ncbi:uncharacterized protein [Spinacia oleracea]|uniref:Reverse transcriptase zinc-binding domain-containing protein n=1 Tax=Spinacia oleracea TaxID=3562 RepID=A0ABM3QYL9_SPIOL|nr:uncharacterized protein LOC130463377 [Spinacia oleracea]
MESDGGGWRNDELMQALTDEETAAVHRVYLAASDQHDFLMWEHTKSGDFTVRSAYHLEMQRQSGNEGASTPDPKTPLWKRIWGAGVPQRVKNLVWRAMRNALPTMHTLASRGVPIDPRCPRCGESAETMEHLVLQCEDSKMLWLTSPARLSDENRECESFTEWCITMSKKCTMHRAWEILMMFIWKAWSLRNMWTFERKRVSTRIACDKTMMLLGEYEAALVRDETPKPPIEPQECRWQTPTLAPYKLNIDAAVREGMIGLGMVVRDREGDTLMTAGRKVATDCLALQAEAEAMYFGLTYAFDAGYRSVEAESDCLQLVQLLRTEHRMRNATQRPCNKVVHAIARSSLSMSEETVWMDDQPDNISALVTSDKASLS